MFILRQAGKAFEANSTGGQLLDAFVNFGNIPARSRGLRRFNFFDFLDAQHCAVVFEHDCERIVTDKRETEDVSIKFQRIRGLLRSDKRDDFGVGQSGNVRLRAVRACSSPIPTVP